MSKQLEIFIKKNKENFDDKIPSPGIWGKIIKKLNTSEKCDLRKRANHF